MKKLILFIALLLPFVVIGQTITKFAGTGSNVYSGDKGPATAAGIITPCFGAFDRFGNYYFADALANRVRKIDTLGIITTVAGNGMGSFFGDEGAATNAKLNRPLGVKLDTSGNLYIVDNQNNRIRKVTVSTGIITTVAGNGTGGFAGDTTPATSAEISDPQDVAVDKRGNIYISDLFNYRIRKVNAAGIISTYAGNGTAGFSGDGFAATNAELDFPTGLAVDDTGNLYITDPGSFSNRVRKVDTFGIITTVAGSAASTYAGDGIPATMAAISPYAIALDSFNNLYITDQNNQRVYKVDGLGILYSVAGNGTLGDAGDNGPATAAELYYPVGIAIDGCSSLYIACTGDITVGAGRRIRKVTYNPTCDPHHHGSSVDSTILLVSAPVEGRDNIFPNPVTSSFSVESGNKIAVVTITNLIGQAVYTQNAETNKIVVDAAWLPPGIYIIKVTDVYGRKAITKITKQ